MTTDPVRHLVEALALVPHPEGGWYRETFRDAVGPHGRSHSTAIYYLVDHGMTAARHRVDAAEVWHHYAGSALELRVDDVIVMLGPDVAGGQRPQAVVPAGAWQSAHARGGWVLAGCTVAPGFHFEGLEIAPGAEGG